MERCYLCRAEGAERRPGQSKPQCERCVQLLKAPPCKACGEPVRDARKDDDEPYHRNCRRCSSCLQVVKRKNVQHIAGKLLCLSCADLFGEFFIPSRRRGRDHMKEVFKQWDLDNNGSIEKDELRRVLKALIPNFADRDLNELLRAIDKNSDGVIDYEEFCEWIAKSDPIQLSEFGFDTFVAGLMKEAGQAAQQAKMLLEEISVRPDGLFFRLRNGNETLQTSSFRSENLDLIVLDPEEFVSKVEVTETGLCLTTNTDRVCKLSGSSVPAGPFSAPPGFSICGLKVKPISAKAKRTDADKDATEFLAGVDFAPLPNASLYSAPTALCFAAQQEFLQTLREILAKAAVDVNSFNPGGVTALMLAAESNCVGAMRMLISCKANPNVADADGWTALTFASLAGHASAIEILVQKGAKSSGDGLAYLKGALRSSNNAAARALLRAGFGTAPIGTYSLENEPLPEDSKLPIPRISPPGGAFTGSVTVKLRVSGEDAEGAEIRYTLDGRDPYAVGRRYIGPFILSQPRLRVRAVTVKGKDCSAVSEATFVVCHYTMPEEVISGAMQVEVFPAAASLVSNGIAKVLSIPRDRLQTEAVPGSAQPASLEARWILARLHDAKPSFRLVIQKNWSLVKTEEKRKKFIENLSADILKAVGEKLENVSVSQGSIIIDFNMPRQKAEELRTLLMDPTSFLCTKAKMRDVFRETRLEAVEDLQTRVTTADFRAKMVSALSTKTFKPQQVLTYGEQDYATVAALVSSSKESKTVKPLLQKVLASVLGDLPGKEIQEVSKELDIEYTVDVVRATSDVDEVPPLNAGQIVEALNGIVSPEEETQGPSFLDRLSDILKNAGLPVDIGVRTKAAARQLVHVELCLTWEPKLPTSKTEVGPIQTHLDSICLAYAGSRLVQIVDMHSQVDASILHFDGEANSKNTEMSRATSRAIKHSGDLTSNGEHVNEQRIRLDLAALPLEVTDLFIVLAAFEADDLSNFTNPTCKLLDPVAGRELTTYTPPSHGKSKAIVMCQMMRLGDGWIMNGLGLPTSGGLNHHEPMKKFLLGLQNSYLRWDRRKEFVKLRLLLKKSRLAESSDNEFAQLLHRILKLPLPIFQLLLKWI